MAIVNPNVGMNVGNLLRLSEEENQRNQLLQKPSALPSSPLRQLVKTTLLSPLPPGTNRVVGQAGEPIVPTEIETPAGAPGVMGPGLTPANGLPGGGNAPGTPMGGGGSVQSSGVNPPMQSNAQGGVRAAAPAQARSSSAVLGARTVAPTSMGVKQAANVPQANVQVPTGQNQFPSTQAWQAAQTPVQHILGGIGKVGTAVTSALNLPQLVPGGAFKQLQNIMAPVINKLFPNFNWGKG